MTPMMWIPTKRKGHLPGIGDLLGVRPASPKHARDPLAQLACQRRTVPADMPIGDILALLVWRTQLSRFHLQYWLSENEEQVSDRLKAAEERFRSAKAELLIDLRNSGHIPTVFSYFIKTESGLGGVKPVVVLKCRRCEKERRRWPLRYVIGLSPRRPCKATRLTDR